MSDESEIMRVIGRLEGKCDQIIDTLRAQVDRMNRIDADIEDLDRKIDGKIDSMTTRLTTVEKKQYTMLTIATIAWGILMVIAKKLF